MSSYPEFLTSITSENIPTPPPDPLPNPIPSTTTIDESATSIRQQITARRRAIVQKSKDLLARFVEEKGNFESLLTEYNTKELSPSDALYKRIGGTRKLMESAKKNYKLAYDEYNSEITDLALAKHMLREVERRLLVVEVALKGIVRETEEGKEGVREGFVESGEVDELKDRLFRMGDEEETWENLPPVGFYMV
jgi:hypothetical protein